jgi:RPA family protein
VESKPAVPIWITELLSGSFNQQDDMPAQVVLADGTALERLRIQGIVVSTNDLVVDDGTGSILVRSFETPASVSIGDPVMVIGRPRVYNGQQYILGEIVKKIDPNWLELRKKTSPAPAAQQQDVLSIVRQLDAGDGADYNAVLAQIGNNEEKIVHLLAVGELFETRPGKLKVLE